uniref:Uncharacterized protein n=1 Tax=Setaria viridis TaxID=4556 RepID=A0A4U6UBG6_SETVI|nr:hypothetical protein SEVIR_5G042366v2 [Setaria viridis]
MGLLCCRRRHGFLSAATTARFPLPATVRPSLCFAVAAVLWICCIVVSLDQKPSLCACRARSWPDAVSLPGHGRMPPLCQAMAGCCLACEAVAPCGRPWLSAGRQLLPLCDAAVCLLPRGCLAVAGRCVPHDVCLPILVLR